jgi:TPP-dependent pyruvate/acetoin dehydrogenase alpha subunit
MTPHISATQFGPFITADLSPVADPGLPSTDALGPLADARALHEPLRLPAEAGPFLPAVERMLTIRRAEERIAEGVEDGSIKCPCHLAIGQEAAAVGVAMHLRRSDRAFGAHRSHAHFIAMGGSLHGLFAEVLGRDSGVSRGMGGSMHLADRSVGFVGSVPIVGATIPIAVGAGLAARLDGHGDVAVAFFGDGATEEGGFHESLNLARLLNAPVLFVCENNLFASHLHISLRQPSNSVGRYAVAHGVPTATVDGNDVVAVSDTVQAALASMRAGGGPYLLECVTYRWRGHVGHREDQDVGVQRKDDLAAWKGRDPIGRLVAGLVGRQLYSADQFAAVDQRVRASVNEAWSAAIVDAYPPPASLLQRVYATPGERK